MEKNLQHELIMWFSQQFPEYRGSLWMVSNEDARHKRNLGMHPGVSDLNYFNKVFAGIELKAPGSSHSRAHIIRQVEWGQQVIDRGGFYFIGSDIILAKKFIIDLMKFNQSSINTITPVLRKLVEGRKTIKF